MKNWDPDYVELNNLRDDYENNIYDYQEMLI